jgi:hypothetical protein
MPPDNATTATHATFEGGVSVVHVPALDGLCWWIPQSDIEDAERFGWWSRVLLRDGIFENQGWQEAARVLFADELAACARGDAAAFAHVVSTVPQAVSFPEVLGGLVHASWKMTPKVFAAVAEALTQRRKDSPFKCPLGAQTRATLLRMGESARVAFEKGEALLEARDAIRAAMEAERWSGLESDDAENAENAMWGRYKAAEKLWNSYPRVVLRVSRCAEHSERRDRLFGPFRVAEESAPRLILSRPVAAQGAQPKPPSVPVWPLYLLEDGWPGIEDRDRGLVDGKGRHEFSVWLPPLADVPLIEPVASSDVDHDSAGELGPQLEPRAGVVHVS